jgi:hypothetical protein
LDVEDVNLQIRGCEKTLVDCDETGPQISGSLSDASERNLFGRSRDICAETAEQNQQSSVKQP